jgi:hypothetical protein
MNAWTSPAVRLLLLVALALAGAVPGASHDDRHRCAGSSTQRVCLGTHRPGGLAVTTRVTHGPDTRHLPRWSPRMKPVDDAQGTRVAALDLRTPVSHLRGLTRSLAEHSLVLRV